MFFVILFSLAIVSLMAVLIIGFGYHGLKTSIGPEWLPEKQEFLQQMIIGVFRWLGVLLTGIVLLGGFIGYYFSRKYMQPIHELAKASNKVEQGNWNKADIIPVKKGSSEMGSLISLFNSMAGNVQKRETKMDNIIRELQLKVDKEKEDELYTEITETDFFKKLEKKSKALRNKRKNEI
jgi:methyl-accepting chemotaxis protein